MRLIPLFSYTHAQGVADELLGPLCCSCDSSSRGRHVALGFSSLGFRVPGQGVLMPHSLRKVRRTQILAHTCSHQEEEGIARELPGRARIQSIGEPGRGSVRLRGSEGGIIRSLETVNRCVYFQTNLLK